MSPPRAAVGEDLGTQNISKCLVVPTDERPPRADMYVVTLVMLAQAFFTLETLRRKNNFWVDPAADAP